MSTYIHGRSEKQLRRARRRRAALVVVVAVVLASFAGWRLADTSRAAAEERAAAAHDESRDPGDAGDAPVTLTAEQRKAADSEAAHDSRLKRLDPELARRFARAQAAAAKDGVTLTLTSGKRSASEQQDLVDAAVLRYGSEQEAHRWVLPPDTSSHVSGKAVDVGGTEGALWLGEHGLALGLCRTYANEVWHFEKLPKDRTTCKEMHPDSSWGW